MEFQESGAVPVLKDQDDCPICRDRKEVQRDGFDRNEHGPEPDDQRDVRVRPMTSAIVRTSRELMASS